MSGHECAQCAAEDPDNTRKPRAVVNTRKPLWCATHRRAEDLRQAKVKRAKAVESKYDITAEDNHQLFLFQLGKCWLCQKATGASKALALDHDHNDDWPRGRLCSTCNQFISRQLGDDPKKAQRVVEYLSGDTPYLRMLLLRKLPKGSEILKVERFAPPNDVVRVIWAHDGVINDGAINRNSLKGDS